MAQQIYFYKDGSNWIIGATKVVYPSGSAVLVPMTTTSYAIRELYNIKLIVSETQVTDFLKKDGTAYANASEFLLATNDFFVKSAEDGNIRTFEVVLTRPANATVYTVGDVIGDVSALLTSFPLVAKANGSGVIISNVRLQTNDTGLAGKNINIHFYNDSITPFADNSALTILDANASKREGVLSVTFGSGNVSKVAQNQYANLLLNPVSRDIYFILETPDGFTPSANSTWIRVCIKCILTN